MPSIWTVTYKKSHLNLTFCLEKLKSNEREKNLVENLGDMNEPTDIVSQKSQEENFNEEVDALLCDISECVKHRMKPHKIKPLFEQLEKYFQGIPASQVSFWWSKFCLSHLRSVST